MATRKTGKKVKTLRAKKLSNRQARGVKGGASDIFAKLGDIKGESISQRPFIEMMPKR